MSDREIRAQMEQDRAAGLDLFRVGQVNAKMQPICGAQNRRGLPCHSIALFPNNRCKHHGGRSRSGPAHPNFRHGRHSKWLPKNLLVDYQASLNDPELLALNHEIAAVDARIAEVGARLGTGEGPSAWQAVAAGYATLIDGLNTGDPDKLRAGVRIIGDAVQRADGDDATWSELLMLIDERRKLVEGERRIEEAAHRVITSKALAVLVAALIDAIRSSVKDQAMLSEIVVKFDAIINDHAVVPHLPG